MKQVPAEYLADLEDHGSTMAMDVDDVDPMDVFGENLLTPVNRIADADFFNSFSDDFDDSDIN